MLNEVIGVSFITQTMLVENVCSWFYLSETVDSEDRLGSVMHQGL